MNRPVLITGGCGFLGSSLAYALQKQGKKVVVLDNLSRVGTRDNLQWLRGTGPLEFIDGTTLNAPLLRETVLRYRPAAVCHLAGQVAMTTSLRDPWADFQANVIGTLNMLECLRKNLPDTALLYSSSNKVYGNLEPVRLVEGPLRYEAPDFPDGLDESMPLDFRTPYGCSKGAADQYVLEYARAYKLPAAVFRHSTIYGGRQNSTYDQGWVGWFCQQALFQKENPSHEPFTISGSGKQVRDLLFVDDAVECYMTGISKIDKLSKGAFNIGGGKDNSLSILELLGDLKTLIKQKIKFKNIDWRYDDQKYYVTNIKKFSQITGWQPKTRKEDGIKAVIGAFPVVKR